MIRAGIAASGPRIVPSKKFVNGINKMINMINGIDRKILTNAPVNKIDQFIRPS